MRTVTGSAKRVMKGVCVVASALAPMPATAMTANGEIRLVDLAAERRLVISLGAVDGAPERSVAVRMPITATLYRFRAELLNAAGEPMGLDFAWGVTFFAATPLAESYEGAVAMARLSTGSHDLHLPRPYGVRLEAGDSITLVATLPTSGAPGAILRITMDYESAPATRLPAVSIAANETVATGSWTWRADVEGRLVAISGRQLVGAKRLVLEDATTGRVVWHMRAQFSVPGVEGQQAEVVRPGVTVQGGRIYRLRAVYAGAAPEQTYGGDTLHALVFPSSFASGAR